MTNPDIWGHIGYVFIAFGMIALSLKIKYGWLFRFIGELIWVALGFHLGLTSIWMWGILFLALDLNGYIKWGKEDEWHDL